MTQTDTHNRDVGGLHQALQVVNGLLAMSRVTGAVADEHTIVVLSDLLDRVVVGEHSHTSSAADETSKDVLLDTTVQQRNVVLAARALNHKGSLGAHALNEIDLTRVNEGLVLVGVVLLTRGDAGEGGTLLSEVRDNSTRVDSRDGRDAFTSAPLRQTLNSGPVAVLNAVIGHNNTGALDVRALEVLEQVPAISLVRGNTVVANQRLSEDQDLASVRRVGHGLGVSNE